LTALAWAICVGALRFASQLPESAATGIAVRLPLGPVGVPGRGSGLASCGLDVLAGPGSGRVSRVSP
jgi:hypothetical protein